MLVGSLRVVLKQVKPLNLGPPDPRSKIAEKGFLGPSWIRGAQI